MRKSSILSLQNLYEVDVNVPSLGLFTERFSKRMIELAEDIDTSVAVCAIGLLRQLLRQSFVFFHLGAGFHSIANFLPGILSDCNWLYASFQTSAPFRGRLSTNI